MLVFFFKFLKAKNTQKFCSYEEEEVDIVFRQIKDLTLFEFR